MVLSSLRDLFDPGTQRQKCRAFFTANNASDGMSAKMI
jgi:hypothetical protein